MAYSKVSEAPSGIVRLLSTTGLALGLALGLGGCSKGDWLNPVSWYRDATGISNGDTTGEERNTQNLDQGAKEPYPNLATVPQPPTNALSAAERDKLRNSLAADQANAKYLENGDQLVPTPPSAAPSPTSPQRPPPTAQPAPAPAPQAPAEPSPSASAPPQSGPSQSGPSQSGPSQPPTSASPPPSASPPSQTASAPPPSSTPAPSGTPIPQGSSAPRAPVRGSEAPPQESTLTPPTVRSVPQGETPRPAPPPPPGVQSQVPAAPTPTPAPAPAPAAAPPLQRPQQTAALPPPSSAPAPAPSAPPGGGSEIVLTVGSVVLRSGNTLLPGDREQLNSIARLRQQNGGTIHVTGYSVPGAGRDAISQQMAGFGSALERAKVVALALAQAGVPAQYLAVGAVPAPPGQPANTVELTLEY